jgi:hypothetical protein
VASFTQSAYEPIAPGIFQTAKEFSEPRQENPEKMKGKKPAAQTIVNSH